MSVRLLAFDKDGTLVAWSVWDSVIGTVLDEFVDAGRRAEAADALAYDLDRREALPGSPVFAGSNDEVIDLLFPFARGRDPLGFHRAVEERFAELAARNVAERPGATALLERARSAGVVVALCTNDSERAARAQIAVLGWTDLIPLVYGYDSGHGAKPGPGMLLAALATAECRASDALMVGDSGADMIAASAAGIRSVYVGVDPAWADAADIAVDGLPDVVDLAFGG